MVVPCAENTPLPNRKQSKQQRAKMLSVYLRPWTLIDEEAIINKPHIANLDSMEISVASHRNMRHVWKNYFSFGCRLYRESLRSYELNGNPQL